MPIQMEIRRIIINEVNAQQIVQLREMDGDRQVPIVIGVFEASSIDRRIRGEKIQRPMTHDLILAVIDEMGGDLQDIFISELKDHTYYAKLRIRKDGEILQIDSRPSDAIAVAVTAKVPIYMAEEVIDEALEGQ